MLGAPLKADLSAPRSARSGDHRSGGQRGEGKDCSRLAPGRPDLVRFLSSPVGGGVVAGAAAAVWAATAFAVAASIRRRGRLAMVGSSRSWSRDAAGDLAVGAFAAGLAVIPLAFSIALSDPFATPKLVGLSVVVPVSAALLAVGKRTPSASLAGGRLAIAATAGFLVWNSLAYIAAGAGGQGFLGERYQLQGLLATALYASTLELTRRLVRDCEALRLLYVAIVTGATGIAVYATIQALGWDLIWGSLATRRAFSTIGQPNSMASALLLGAAPCLALMFLARSRVQRAVLGACLALIAAALLTSGSRGGFLGMAVSIAVWIGLQRRERGSMRRIGRLGLRIAAVLALAFFLVPSMRTVGGLAVSRSVRGLAVTADQSAQEHLLLWEIGGRIAFDHPLLGVGPERFPLVFPSYRDAYLSSEWSTVFRPFRVESPHNVYIAVADAAGLPALALYLAVIAAALSGYRRMFMNSAGRASSLLATAALASLSGHLVTDLFMTADLTASWVFWALMGGGLFALAGPRVQRRPLPDRVRQEALAPVFAFLRDPGGSWRRSMDDWIGRFRSAGRALASSLRTLALVLAEGIGIVGAAALVACHRLWCSTSSVSTASLRWLRVHSPAMRRWLDARGRMLRHVSVDAAFALRRVAILTARAAVRIGERIVEAADTAAQAARSATRAAADASAIATSRAWRASLRWLRVHGPAMRRWLDARGRMLRHGSVDAALALRRVAILTARAAVCIGERIVGSIGTVAGALHAAGLVASAIFALACARSWRASLRWLRVHGPAMRRWLDARGRMLRHGSVDAALVLRRVAILIAWAAVRVGRAFVETTVIASRMVATGTAAAAEALGAAAGHAWRAWRWWSRLHRPRIRRWIEAQGRILRGASVAAGRVVLLQIARVVLSAGTLFRTPPSG